MKRVAVLLLPLLFVALGSMAQADDQAAVLARILAEKGVLTAADVDRVSAAAPDDRVVVLAALLREKGVLGEADLARLDGRPGARVVSVAAVNGAPAAAQAPQAQKQAAAAVPPPPQPVTSGSKLPLTLYGIIVWNGFFNASGMNIQDVPLVATKQGTDPLHNDKSFGMTVRQSRVGLRYQGPAVAGARVSGLFEIDLFGGKAALPNGINMDMFRVRLAYGRLDWKNASLQAGQDWSLFGPLNPVSLAGFGIPEFAAAGNPWIRTPQLRFEYRQSLSDTSRLTWAVAAADSNAGDYPAEFRTVRVPGVGERGRMPAIEARLGLNAKLGGRDASAGVSTHYAHHRNTGLLGGTAVERGVESWGVALDYSVPIHPRLSFTGEVFGGRALGIFSASLGQAVLPVGTPGEHGVGVVGGWTQAQINLARAWLLHAGYGVDKPDSSNLRTGDRSRNQAFMASLTYRYSPHVTMAWEWKRLLSDYLNQRQANERGNHYNMAVGYTF